MSDGLNVAEVAALVGDPGRANMLTALLDGRALTATELAHLAGITPQTASGHLAKLAQGRLIVPAVQGRHRYYSLASTDVARMLEGIMVVAVEPAAPHRRATPRIGAAMREARTCYDHIAGRLGVGIADALGARGAIVLSSEAGEITPAGLAMLDGLGVSTDLPRGTRRLLCRPCLDWSERRPHLAGVLGAALLQRTLALGWVRRAEIGRALTITPGGRRGFADALGLDLCEH